MKKIKKVINNNDVSTLEKHLTQTLPKSINVKNFMASKEMMDILYRMIGSELKYGKK